MQWRVAQSPLIGRDRELAAAAAALAPGRPGVLIAGPAGVGKTRLAREATGRLPGRRVLSVQCGGGHGLVLAGLTGLLPATAEASAQGPAQWALRRLRDLSRHEQLVFAVDDAHRLDEVSASVLLQAVAEGVGTLLATMRVDEPVPAGVTQWWKDAEVVRVDLAPLTPDETRTLLTAMLGGPVEGQSSRRLVDAAGGNPLFLRESLHSVREAGLLERTAGLWRLTGPMTSSPRLAELLRRRLATGDDREREALELVAAGEPVPLALAASVADETGLESLERRGLITVDESVRLSHPMFGELLRADTPVLTTRRHLRRLADALEAAGHADSGTDLVRLAWWRLDGGGTGDPRLMLAAAGQAMLAREYEPSARLAQRSFETSHDIEAGVLAVRALVQLGRVDRGLALCGDLLTKAVTGEERAEVAIAHAEILAHLDDDVSAALRALDTAGEDAGGYRLYLRSYQLDCSVVEPAMAIFLDRDAPAGTRLAAACAAGCALLLAGQITEAESLVARSLPLAIPNIGPSHLQSSGMSPTMAILACYRPDPEAAETIARQGYEASLHPPHPVSQALHALTLAQITLMRGGMRTAIRWAREARLVAGEIGLRPVCRWSAAVRLLAVAQLGMVSELDDAADDLAQCSELPDRVRLFEIDVARARAWLAATRGDAAAGQSSLARAVADHGESGAVGHGTLGALDLIRLGTAGQAAELLDRFPPHPSWPLGRTIVDYAAAARADDSAALLDVAQRFARHGMPLYAAEAAAMASAAPAVAARANLFADSQLRRIPEPVSTPALLRRGSAAQLTARENEVVLAAARGDQNKTIAERLHLSERTVENHLHRAYHKLGVTGRSELRAALGLI